MDPGNKLTIFILSRRIVGYITFRQASRRNGCYPPRKDPHLDSILGLDMFFDQFKAMKRGNITAAERERFLRYGKTFEANSWGTRCIHTVEVANIQAVLSRLFDRFGIAPLRLPIYWEGCLHDRWRRLAAFTRVDQTNICTSSNS